MNGLEPNRTAADIAQQPRSLIWHELALMSLLLMEVSWITPWFRSFWPSALPLSTLQVLLLLLGHGLVALNLGKLMRHPTANGGLRTLGLLAAMAVGLYISLKIIVYPHFTGGLRAMVLVILLSFANVFSRPPAALIMILSVMYVWRRSVLLSSSIVLETSTAGFRFRLGVLVLGLFAVVRRGEQADMLFEVLPLYFGAGLLSMALSRADSLSLARGARRSPFTGGWLVAVLLIVAATVALGGGLGILLRTRAAQSMAGVLAVGIVGLAVVVLSPLLLGLYYVFSGIVGWLLRVWPSEEQFEQSLESVKGLESMLEDLREQAGQQQPAFIAWLQEHSAELTIILTSLAVLMLAYVSVRIGRRYMQLRNRANQEEAESLFSASEMTDDLKRRLKELRDRLAGQRPIKRLQRLITASTVRHIYARLLVLAEKCGSGREVAETPLEFLDKLVELFPANTLEVTTITHAYTEVRYGEFPEEQIDLGLVREGWAAIRRGARAKPPAKAEG